MSRSKRRSLLTLAVLVLALTVVVLVRNANKPTEPWIPPNQLSQPSPIAVSRTPPDFRVAFLGDQGLTGDSRSVLQLVKSEGAQLLIILGDFDYRDSPDAWDALLSQVLGKDFPILAVVGNHDVKQWRGYR